MEEINIDAGTLSVYQCEEIKKEITQEEIFKISSNLFLQLKEKLKEEIILAEQEQNLRKLEHRVIDFDKNKNEIRLPSSTLKLPRMLAYNPSKYKTKWEKFAEEKGIKKKTKRSRLVYNEEIKDWVPRWGKDSVKKIQEDIIKLGLDLGGFGATGYYGNYTTATIKAIQDLKHLNISSR